MSINKIMTNAMRTQWNITDDFSCLFFNRKYNLTEIANKAGLSNAQELLDICIINIDMPQLSGDIEAVLVAGEYRLNAKKFQPFTITLTFRDILGLKLRDYFMNIWTSTQTEYYDDIKSSIEIATANSDQGKNLLFKSDDCLIASVSQVQLDNSNTQISEFSVEFQTAYYTNSDLNAFGRREFGKY